MKRLVGKSPIRSTQQLTLNINQCDKIRGAFLIAVDYTEQFKKIWVE